MRIRNLKNINGNSGVNHFLILALSAECDIWHFQCAPGAQTMCQPFAKKIVNLHFLVPMIHPRIGLRIPGLKISVVLICSNFSRAGVMVNSYLHGRICEPSSSRGSLSYFQRRGVFKSLYQSYIDDSFTSAVMVVGNHKLCQFLVVYFFGLAYRSTAIGPQIRKEFQQPDVVGVAFRHLLYQIDTVASF